MTEAYPLQWPEGWKRTPPHRRQTSRYQVNFAKARDDLIAELVRLEYRNKGRVVISTNVALRRDNIPYANQREPDDPGVAVYFLRENKQHVIACDAWRKVKDNVRACGLTIQALRMLDRTGASGILDRAFSGFQQLPGPDAVQSWSVVLGVHPTDSHAHIRYEYQRLRKIHHPDHGGDAERFRRVQDAWIQYNKQLNRTA